jgi:hypothetical protein
LPPDVTAWCTCVSIAQAAADNKCYMHDCQTTYGQHSLRSTGISLATIWLATMSRQSLVTGSNQDRA